MVQSVQIISQKSHMLSMVGYIGANNIKFYCIIVEKFRGDLGGLPSKISNYKSWNFRRESPQIPLSEILLHIIN